MAVEPLGHTADQLALGPGHAVVMHDPADFHPEAIPIESLRSTAPKRRRFLSRYAVRAFETLDLGAADHDIVALDQMLIMISGRKYQPANGCVSRIVGTRLGDRGRTMWNVVPRPGSLSPQMWPPNCFTMP